MPATIDAMIITFNESANLPDCLSALTSWIKQIYVVDSGSTDGTQQIARSLGATVVDHAWEGYARQKNWGLRTLTFESDWILILDADEIVTLELRAKLQEIASQPIDAVPENGFFINRLTYFLGQPIRHCGYFPSWNLRLIKRGKGSYEDREVHEHVIIQNPVGYVKEPMLHIDRRGLEHYIAKHNRYSTLEARALFREITNPPATLSPPNLSRATRLNRWLKRNLMPWVPLPATWRFLYMYVIRFGFLDGRAGLAFCKFIGMHDYMLSLKLREALRQYHRHGIDPYLPENHGGLVHPEGQISSDLTDSPTPSEAAPHEQLQPEASPWSFKEKLGRALWMLIGRPIFRLSFHNWHPLRVAVLRLFGAKIGRGVAIRPSVNVEVPWMLRIEDNATVGDHAILYSLGAIQIGKRSIISQYAHLCAGTHDYTDHRFRLIRAPITIGHDVWIGADAFIGPQVNIGDLTVVGARSSVYKDLPAKQVCIGNPAKPVRERLLQ